MRPAHDDAPLVYRGQIALAILLCEIALVLLSIALLTR